MADRFAAAAGAMSPRSYISTGNVTFSATSGEIPGIVQDAERAIGRREEVFVRTIHHLQAMVAADPFAASPYEDAVERTVSFAREPIDPAALGLPIRSPRDDVALFAADPGGVYGVPRLVDGRTSAPGGLVENVVGQRVTSRSWSTIRRIADDPE
jgi:uncharacterized protein (DUF1697 family)